MSGAMLSVEKLVTTFSTDDGQVTPVDGVSFTVGRGETVGLVGESGCGKSVTSLSVLRLLPSPAGRIAGGRILFEGRDLVALSEREMRNIRGRDIAMIFQEPMTSLNPVFTCGNQIIEALRRHKRVSVAEAREQALELLRLVGIPMPEQRLNAYPHQLSGGMRQRVMIAMALSCNPRMLIADEPTTALDVTIQAQILDLLRQLKQRFAMAVLLITHDLGVVAETAERVVVMYAGRVVEEAPVRDIFHKPLHPYTEGLLRSVPRLDRRCGSLSVIEGVAPDFFNLPSGCRFHPRCPLSERRCTEEVPRLISPAEGRRVACWRYSIERGGVV